MTSSIRSQSEIDRLTDRRGEKIRVISQEPRGKKNKQTFLLSPSLSVLGVTGLFYLKAGVQEEKEEEEERDEEGQPLFKVSVILPVVPIKVSEPSGFIGGEL